MVAGNDSSRSPPKIHRSNTAPPLIFRLSHLGWHHRSRMTHKRLFMRAERFEKPIDPDPNYYPYDQRAEGPGGQTSTLDPPPLRCCHADRSLLRVDDMAALT